jgi:renalase
MANVTIIGAGLSGLVAARELQDAGHDVVIYESSDVVGGRMATRMVSDARVDHGAQFFTVRGDEFQSVVDKAIDAGAVQEWCRGFGEPDGYPRYRGTDGMTSFPTFLAEGLDIRFGRPIADLQTVDGDAYVVTAPIPLALDLLANSGMAPDNKLASELRSVRYNRTIAGMFVLSEPSPMEHPGALQQPDDPTLTFVADNRVKGITSVPSLTVHASNAWSVQQWDRPDDDIEQDLLMEAIKYMGEHAHAYDFEIHKWLYAGPQNPWPDPFCVTNEEPLVLLAGDSFKGPKVEGAFNSGLAAGRELARRLG